MNKRQRKKHKRKCTKYNGTIWMFEPKDYRKKSKRKKAILIYVET